MLFALRRLRERLCARPLAMCLLSIVADDMSKNALSTFIGAFIFSIVALNLPHDVTTLESVADALIDADVAAAADPVRA